MYVNILGLTSGITTILIITKYYNLLFQSEYYITTALVSWIILFDFGISQTLLYVSKKSKRKIENAIGCYLSYYVAFGLLFIILYKSYNPETTWESILYFLIFLLNGALSIILSYIRGQGEEIYYWKARSFEFTIYTLTLTLTLLYGLSIYSLVIAISLSSLVNFISIIKIIDIKTFKITLNPKPWLSTLANTQIRVAVEYVSFLIGLKIAIPFVKSQLGAILTGKIALTLTLLSIPLSISIALHTTKISSFVFNNQEKNIKNKYIRWSLFITTFFTLLNFFIIILITMDNISYINERIANIKIITAIMLGNLVSLILYLISNWLRINNHDIGWKCILIFNISQLIVFTLSFNIVFSIYTSLFLLIAFIILSSLINSWRH
ncbi:hypothetical protein [Photorhabdus sp. RM96S]|uniref:hypothetical protein n=1 Tax=Photorhabdus sp. RM96S TaxID=3342822 RepID=UPI0036D8AB7C